MKIIRRHQNERLAPIVHLPTMNWISSSTMTSNTAWGGRVKKKVDAGRTQEIF